MSPSIQMSVYLTTFNMNMRSSKLSDQELQAWFAPAFEYGGPQPDLIAVGIQELLPLELALAGWAETALKALTSRIQVTLAKLTEAVYTVIASTTHGGVAILVIAKDTIATSGRISKPSTACLALGDAGLSNKAAVGVRVAVNRGEEGREAWESFTFVSAHLAAHDYNVKRRNEQYLSILSGLLFTPSAVLTLPQRIFDSSHCFLLGDLNYRLSKLPSVGHALSQKVLDDAHQDDLLQEREELFALDTLQQEQSQSRSLLGLREGDIRTFAPTYKRIVGQQDGYSVKRIPGYTDRILYASSNDGAQDDTSVPGPEDPKTRVRMYNAINEITLSDHKPVYSVVSIPAPTATTSGRSSPHNTPHLAVSFVLPPRQDQAILALWRGWGFVVDRVAGYSWLFTVVLGGGNLLIGLAVEAVLLVGFLAYRSGFFRL